MRKNIRKIGLIGNGNQSKRIQKILRNKRISFFVYKPKNKRYYDEESFKELKKCEIIFILSPSKTHFYYLNKLYKKRYIFCEKPPVTSISELNKLKKIINGKIYFNFNFRYSLISKILSETKKFNLGKFIYGNIITGHGLAFKSDYLKNWRSQKKKCKKGIFEIVSIHWIDLINHIFKNKKRIENNINNFSGRGSSYDNSFTKIKFQTGQEVDIISSYTSPLIQRKIFLFTNGLIEQDEKKIVISGPAMNLDNANLFVRPKIKKKFISNEKSDYVQSIEKSVEYFLKISMKNLQFTKEEINNSINTNRLVL